MKELADKPKTETAKEELPKVVAKAVPAARTVKLIATQAAMGYMVNPFNKLRFTPDVPKMVDDYQEGSWEDCQVKAGLLRIVE